MIDRRKKKFQRKVTKKDKRLRTAIRVKEIDTQICKMLQI